MMVEADTTGYVEPPIDDEPNDLKPEQIPEIVEQAGNQLKMISSVPIKVS